MRALAAIVLFLSATATAQQTSYIRVRDDGTNIPQRYTLNFGAGIACTDDTTNKETDCVASGGAAPVSVDDCGANPRDSVDDTSAINTCITNICTNRVGAGTFTDGYGGILEFSYGKYIISSTINVWNCQGLVMRGKGKGGATVIEWENGTTGQAMIQVRDSPYFELSDMMLKPSDDAAIVNTAIIDDYRTDDSYSGSYAFGNWHHRFRNLWLGGWDTGYFQRGVWIRAENSTADANHDGFVFDSVRIEGGTVANVSIEHTQSVAHSFYDCYLTGSPYGVTNALGVGSNPTTGGSFHWYGGFVTQHTVADFYVQTGSGANFTVQGTNSENSARFFKTAGVSNNSGAVALIDNRFAASGIDPDNNWVLAKFVGSFLIQGNYYCDGASATPRVGMDNGGANNMVVSFIGNACSFAGSDSVHPIVFSGGTSNSIFLAGNTFTTSGGTPVGKYDGWNGALDDRLLVGNGGSLEQKALTDCDDGSGQHMNYDTSTNAFSCGTSVHPNPNFASVTIDGTNELDVNGHGYTQSTQKTWVGAIGSFVSPATEDRLVVNYTGTDANLLLGVDNASPSTAGILFGNRSTRAAGVLRYNYGSTRMEWAPAGTRVFHVSNGGEIASTSTKTRGTITLSAGTGTATITSGAICVCSSTTANPAYCNESGTTLTATGTGTDAVRYHCIDP